MDAKTPCNHSSENLQIVVNGTLMDIPRNQLADPLSVFFIGFCNTKLKRTMREQPEEWDEYRLQHMNYNPVLKEVADKIMTWDYKTPLVCSILSHQNGIGKTHMAVASYRLYLALQIRYEFVEMILDERYSAKALEIKLAKWVEEPYPNVIFINEADILRSIQETYDDKKLSEDDVMKRYIKAELLVIDDAFSGKVSDFNRRVILEILDKRSERYMKPTIITSNLLLPDIANTVDTRIADRMRGEQLHQITEHVPSWRSKR
jgi:hypothetical protein